MDDFESYKQARRDRNKAEKERLKGKVIHQTSSWNRAAQRADPKGYAKAVEREARAQEVEGGGS